MGPRSPLRSAQSRHPPDVLRSPLRSGRCRTDVPRTSCNPSSAWLRLLWGRRPWFKVSPPARSLQNRRPPGRLATRLPQGFGCCVAGAHGSKVSAPLRSLQNRRPPDVLQPIFRMASVVAWQAPYGSKVSPLHSIFHVKMG